MKTLSKVYTSLTDSSNRIGFDNQLVILACLFAVLAYFLGVIVNYILPLGKVVQIVGITGLILNLGLYVLARFGKRYTLTKILFAISLPISMDVLWFTNFGSAGPIIYIYIVAYTGFLFFLDGRLLTFYSIFFLLNTLGMFLLELNQPELLGTYPDIKTRIIDVYSGLLIYLVVTTLLMVHIKKGFTRERDKALDSEKLKSAFLANMSHEIRTPLNSILGFNQLMEKKNNDEKLKNYIKQIDQNGNYLLQIMEDILQLSRIEAGELQLSNNLIVVKELFEDIFFMLNNHYNLYIQSQAKITYRIEPDELVLYSDYTRLKQIILNLLTNSMKFTAEGEIEYSCELQKNRVHFMVKDNGEGIDEEYHNVIFNRFRKIENDKSVLHPGTGLGLSITKELVEMMGGSIWFHSSKNKGTEFFFSIPMQSPPHKD